MEARQNHHRQLRVLSSRRRRCVFCAGGFWVASLVALRSVVPSTAFFLASYSTPTTQTVVDVSSRRRPGAARRPSPLVVVMEMTTSTDSSVAPPISSPFETGAPIDDDDDEELPLTLENVERVLDELRPYLMSDGGNVRVAAIDGPVVRLELEGACGTCPSSTMTMKMGLERRLKEVIPEISEVVQALPESPDLTLDAVNEVLDGVRPFLSVAGGQVDVADLSGVGTVQPVLLLSLTGKSASLHSVKQEIAQRIHRYFMAPGLRVEWDAV